VPGSKFLLATTTATTTAVTVVVHEAKMELGCMECDHHCPSHGVRNSSHGSTLVHEAKRSWVIWSVIIIVHHIMVYVRTMTTPNSPATENLYGSIVEKHQFYSNLALD
jgi:hypothetical protein